MPLKGASGTRCCELPIANHNNSMKTLLQYAVVRPGTPEMHKRSTKASQSHAWFSQGTSGYHPLAHADEW